MVATKAIQPEDVGLAALWTTDPISEFAGVVELRTGRIEGGPKDIYLVLDGIFFTKGVEDHDIPLLFNCFRSINRRIGKLHGIMTEVKERCEAAEEACSKMEKLVPGTKPAGR